ncbi:MAG TPA: hypothetical protein VGA18_04095, partial [Rhodothermales bacterium]
MKKSEIEKWLGMHLRLLPVPIGPDGAPVEEDWLVRRHQGDATEFQTVSGAHAAVVGHDSIYGYTNEPGRDTATTKYGCIQLLAQVEIRRDGEARVT